MISQVVGEWEASGSSEQTRNKRFFWVIGPKLWNDLSLSIKQADFITMFKSRHKTYFYSLAFNQELEVVALTLCLCATVLFI